MKTTTIFLYVCHALRKEKGTKMDRKREECLTENRRERVFLRQKGVRKKRWWSTRTRQALLVATLNKIFIKLKDRALVY